MTELKFLRYSLVKTLTYPYLKIQDIAAGLSSHILVAELGKKKV